MKQPARTYILAIALAIVSATANGGTNTNLTQLTAPGVLGDGWAPTADSERVVFVAPGTTAQEIYSVRFDEPGQIIRLSRNGELDGAAEVVRFEVSADSQHVVYKVLLPGILEDSERLLTVPIDGSTTPSTLSNVGLGTLGGGGIAFTVSPASDRVVYLETTEVTFPFTESELFSQIITGGGTATLHPVALSISFGISQNGARVVYLVSSLTENSKIFSVPTAGGLRVQLNDDNDFASLFSVGPNSQRVVFTAINQEGEDATLSLQSVLITGGGQTTLATPAEAVGINAFGINNDTGSPRVVFVEVTGSGQSRLVSVLITGGGVEDLTNGFVDGGISQFLFSPDGQRVLFQVVETLITEGVDQFTAELFSAPVDGLGQGGAPSTFFEGFANNTLFNFIPSFDSTRLLYGAIDLDDQGGELPGIKKLLSSGINGDDAQTLVGPLSGNLRVSFFFPFFDSQNVFYLADQEQDEIFELYTVPIAGGAITKQNNPLPAGGDVTSAFPTPDSSKLVYNADQEANELFDLFLVQGGEEPPEVIFSCGGFEDSCN
jgi:hypothetical protein